MHIFMDLKLLRTLSGTFLLSFSIAVFAVPAKRGMKRLIKLVDGRQVAATLHGDEWGSYWETADGSCYQVQDTTGLFHAVNKHTILRHSAALRAKANASRMERINGIRTRAGIGEGHIPYTGVKRGVIILVQFKDKKFTFGHNKAYYDRVANGPLSDAQRSIGFQGSVKDYFLAQSNGTFELQFDVVGPYTLKNKYAYYGAHSGGANDVRPGEMIEEAVKLADPDVDYKQYDWDGNGFVDQVAVIYAGPGEAAGGDENTIWPHEWTLSAAIGKSVSLDGVGISRYSCSSETTYNEYGATTQIAGLGTICHEFSHCLGLPDMYDTNYQNAGMGVWDLMDQGSYNGGQFLPPNYSAYEKWYAGWLEPTELNAPTSVRNLPAPDVRYGQAYVIYNDAHKDEYYLLENRQNNVGLWDTGLPGSGLMILHIDYSKEAWESNLINNTSSYPDITDHERAYLFRADNKSADSDAQDDLYPFGDNNSLTDTSTPAAVIFNGGQFMGKPITNISKNEDGTVNFDFMGGSESNVINGIRAVSVQKGLEEDHIFTLDGRYVGKDLLRLAPGVYVRGGKKIVR